MAFDFDAPEELTQGGGGFLFEPGTYHFSITQVYEGTGPKGNPINGFCFAMQVLAGTAEGQEEKEIDLVFFDPNLSHSDTAQRINKEAQTAALIAAGCLTPADLGKRVSIDLQKAVGSQVIAQLSENEYNGRKNLRLHFSNIWHVDDPKAKTFPKSAEALALIPADQRKGEEYFEPLKAGKTAKRESSPLTEQQLAEL